MIIFGNPSITTPDDPVENFHARAAHALTSKEEVDRERLLVPSPETAAAQVATTSETYNQWRAEVAAKKVVRDLAQAAADVAQAEADKLQADIDQEYGRKALALRREGEAIRDGRGAPAPDLRRYDAQIEVWQRHAAIKREILTEKTVLLGKADAELSDAHGCEHEALQNLRRAEVMQVAARVLTAAVDELLPVIDAYKATKPEPMNVRRMYEQLTRTASPIISEDAVRVLGPGPKPVKKPTANAPAEPMVMAVVKPGEHFGSHRGGTYIEVSEKEYKHELARLDFEGNHIGALVPVADYERDQQVAADAKAAREAARAQPSMVQRMVEEGLVLLGLKGEEEKLAKEAAAAEERRHKAVLAQLAEHQLLEAQHREAGRAEARLAEHMLTSADEVDDE